MSDTHDWSVLDNPELVDLCEYVVETVSYNRNLDADDLLQDAYVLVTATGGDLHAITSEPENFGLLAFRLEQQLINKHKTDIRRRDKAVSLDVRIEEGDESIPYAPYVPRKDGAVYTRELVEALLPAVWDEEYAYGMRQENAPDPDMPRSSSNKSTGNTLAAHIADIRRAWELTDLLDAERRTLLLSHGFDWSSVEISFNQELTKRAIDKRLYSGVGKIVAFLNGDLALRAELDNDEEELND